MDDEVAQKFINSVVKNLQVLCHSNVIFDRNVEVIGHLYLNVDSQTKMNYIVNEKVCKNEASSTVFVSNSFHAEVGVKKKEKPRPPEEDSHRDKRGASQFSPRHSFDTSSYKRDHHNQGPSFAPAPKMSRISDHGSASHNQRDTRMQAFSPNRHRVSQDSSTTGSDHSQSIHSSPRKSPIEVDLSRVKKEFASGHCSMSEDNRASGHGGASFSSEPPDIPPSIDFSTAFPVSLHQSQTLASAISLHESMSGHSNNNNSSDFEQVDQKPFVHNTGGEPPFTSLIPGGGQRLRPPWPGANPTSPAASQQQNFPGKRLSSESASGFSHTQSATNMMVNFTPRYRTVFSKEQVDELEEAFQRSSNLTGTQKEEIAARLNIDSYRVTTWFNRRRKKDREQKYS